jgi:hypothetical protein
MTLLEDSRNQNASAMDKSQSAKVHRFVEALYDIESGKTVVRHPNKENQWLECTLLNRVVEGRLVASVSGHDQCEIFSVPPIGKPAPLESTKHLDLFITFRGRNCFRC